MEYAILSIEARIRGRSVLRSPRSSDPRNGSPAAVFSTMRAKSSTSLCFAQTAVLMATGVCAIRRKRVGRLGVMGQRNDERCEHLGQRWRME